ncbi:MAG: porin [Planctomycetota bacterium]
MAELERQVQQLAEQVEELKRQRAEQASRQAEGAERVAGLEGRLDQISRSAVLAANSWVDRLTLGGYGEIHANFDGGESRDQIDIHRLVLYLGYDFSDWIKFHSETELEHAFVSDESGGELSIEQAYVDFLLSEAFNVRLGRILTPLGIINKTHEPPTFHGVERPSFAKFIIPTTWSSDGVGIFGALSPSLRYEAYVVAGLDGSKFNALNGIRGGRIKERPSLQEPAVTGRLDWHPFITRPVAHDQRLRLGVSGYYGGLNNGNEGQDPDIDGSIRILSADFEYSLSQFDFRGAIAHTDITGAHEIGNGTASEMFGWYLDAGYHFWPDAWKQGKLAEADAVAFVRYDDFDTQYRMPSGVPRDPAGDRTEWTLGVNFYLQPNFVLKADYQIRDDESGQDLDDLFNLGVGWTF